MTSKEFESEMWKHLLRKAAAEADEAELKCKKVIAEIDVAKAHAAHIRRLKRDDF